LQKDLGVKKFGHFSIFGQKII